MARLQRSIVRTSIMDEMETKAPCYSATTNWKEQLDDGLVAEHHSCEIAGRDFHCLERQPRSTVLVSYDRRIGVAGSQTTLDQVAVRCGRLRVPCGKPTHNGNVHTTNRQGAKDHLLFQAGEIQPRSRDGCSSREKDSIWTADDRGCLEKGVDAYTENERAPQVRNE
jgi:hypothetical protein